MSRTTERASTKSAWRLDKSQPYGIAAHRRAKESRDRAAAEHAAAQDRSGKGDNK
jgi:hypothetical protein